MITPKKPEYDDETGGWWYRNKFYDSYPEDEVIADEAGLEDYYEARLEERREQEWAKATNRCE